MKKMMILSCLILSWASITLLSCATVPKGPLAPGELRLLSMEVPKDIRKAVPYEVVITFEANGEPEIKDACFYWSGEGPYCFKLKKVTFGSPGTFKVRLQTNNPGSYTLNCQVQYVREGKIRLTNYVGSQIYVR